MSGARDAAVATGAVYVCLFGALGAHLPFWPLWLADRGLGEAEIGALLGFAAAVRVAAGVAAPWLADVSGRRRDALAGLAALGALAFAAHAAAGDLASLYALTALAALAMAGALPIGDALAAAAARRHGFQYAQARAAGSAAFLAANLACGALVARFGADAALWWLVAAQAALVGAALRHPGGGRRGAARARPLAALGLLRDRPILLAGAAAALIQASHGPLYAYGSLHWRALGVPEATIGGLWAFGVAVEVALMAAVGQRLTARLGARGLLLLGAAAAALRWSAMTLAPLGAPLWALQVTHALTFAPAHLALIAAIAARAPEALAASAQGLLAAGVGGLAMAGATVAAAAIYPSAGAGVFWLAAGLAAAGGGLALALKRA